MLRGRTVKLVLYEVLQFAAFGAPVFVVMERFAALMRQVRGGDPTAYWLVVAASLAYVTSVTLLVWVPLKYLIVKQRRFVTRIVQWRPTTLAYVLLATLPCFAIIIASSKVQVDRGLRYDTFTELPVSLVFLCLICVDIIERIRPCPLTGQEDSLDLDLDIRGPVLTHLEPVSTVAGQLYSDGAQNGSPARPDHRNGPAAERWSDRELYGPVSVTSSRPAGAAYLYSSSRSPSGPLRFLWARDTRSEVVLDSFLFWMDTVEMVRVAGEPAVFFSVWVFPVYILASLSTLRLAITPHNPLLSSAGFVTQDFPFLVIRIALIVAFGYVTPVLYPVKNLMMCFAYVYFTFLTKLKFFGRESMF